MFRLQSAFVTHSASTISYTSSRAYEQYERIYGKKTSLKKLARDGAIPTESSTDWYHRLYDPFGCRDSAQARQAIKEHKLNVRPHDGRRRLGRGQKQRKRRQNVRNRIISMNRVSAPRSLGIEVQNAVRSAEEKRVAQAVAMAKARLKQGPKVLHCTGWPTRPGIPTSRKYV